jgi:GDP-L-fucose synthase
MQEKKTVLVTGSFGLVGSAIQRLAHFYNYKFVFSGSQDCDLTNYKETNDYFNKEKPNIVIHLAACVGGLYKNMNNKVEMLENNLLINFNVIKCCHNIGVERCICVLSTCIFPDKTSYPIDETMLHNGPPHNSNDAYAYAKRMMEVHCRAYNENSKTNYSCIIPTNIYGANDNYSLTDGHVIPSLIHRCHLAKLNGEPFEVRGTGLPIRQFVYSDDLAQLILECINRLTRENIIIAPREEHSIGYVATLIAREYDYEDQIVLNTSFSDGQYKKTANNAKLRNLFPNFRFTEIEDGIRESVIFFKNNYDNPNCRLK